MKNTRSASKSAHKVVRKHQVFAWQKAKSTSMVQNIWHSRGCTISQMRPSCRDSTPLNPLHGFHGLAPLRLIFGAGPMICPCSKPSSPGFYGMMFSPPLSHPSARRKSHQISGPVGHGHDSLRNPTVVVCLNSLSGC